MFSVENKNGRVTGTRTGFAWCQPPLQFLVSAFNKTLSITGASQVALVVKNHPEKAGDVRDASLIRESGDLLEKGMATHSSILAWKTPWTEEPGGLQSMALQRVGHNRVTSVHK